MGLQGSLDNGLVPLTIFTLFHLTQQLQNQRDGQYQVTYKVQLSFLQLYLDKIEDLLNPGSGRKLVKRNGETLVEDLVYAEVSSEEEALLLIKTGLKYRQTGKQNLNANSSRSHTILSVVVNKYIEDLSTGQCDLTVKQL